MVKGESRYFTLTPGGGGGIAGYTATYEVTREQEDTPHSTGAVTNDGTVFNVKIQTTNFDYGRHKLNVFIKNTVDDFVQVYSETFEITR